MSSEAMIPTLRERARAAREKEEAEQQVRDHEYVKSQRRNLIDLLRGYLGDEHLDSVASVISNTGNRHYVARVEDILFTAIAHEGCFPLWRLHAARLCPRCNAVITSSAMAVPFGTLAWLDDALAELPELMERHRCPDTIKKPSAAPAPTADQIMAKFDVMVAGLRKFVEGDGE